jgi:murein DD-endopeptidase MepM/ murein hydrolase activator NlpD
VVVVDHGGVVSYYAHLSRVMVDPGQVVGAGQRLGSVGTTGNATGPHLHFEVRVGGVARDPEAFLGPLGPAR